MSTAQKRRIQRESLGSLFIGLLGLAIVVILLLLPADTFANPSLMRGIYGGVGMLLAAVGLFTFRRETLVIRAGTVAQAQGVPRFEKRRSIYRMTVGEHELWLTRAQANLLEDGQAYIVYFATSSPILLSAETLNSAP